MTIVHKICPVVLRRRLGRAELLAFEHPLAGRQLVKGTVEPDESLEAAASRELIEESGVETDLSWTHLGSSTSIVDGQIWFFLARRLDGLPDAWVFHTQDDGGQDFRFYWHDLEVSPGVDWHPSFADAVRFVSENLPGDPFIDTE